MQAEQSDTRPDTRPDRPDAQPRVLSVAATSGGALAWCEADGVSLIQYPATELEASPAGLTLRLRAPGQTSWRCHRLLGPGSGGRLRLAAGGLPVVGGSVDGLTWTAWLRTVPQWRWAWYIDVRNDGPDLVDVDVVHTHDPALATWEQLRRNELYVSQYLDVTPLECAGGIALAVRQNMPGERNPWLAVRSLRHAVGWATDARQLADGSVRRQGGLARDLPNARLQHEHTLIALQDAAVMLEPGATHRTGFAGVFLHDHPAASGSADAAVIDAGDWDLDGETPSLEDARPVPESLFAAEAVLPVTDLAERDVFALVPGDVELHGGPRHVERGPDGELWSCVGGDDAHVVTRAKEAAVLRPHGHIVMTGDQPRVDRAVVASTCWMAGVFASQLSQGHAGDAVLSVRRGYVDASRATGLRIFVQDAADGPDAPWRLLEVPSAWIVQPRSARWVYDEPARRLDVEVTAHAAAPRLLVTARVTRGRPVRWRAAFALEVPEGAQAPTSERDGDRIVVSLPAGSPLAERYPGGSWSVSWHTRAVVSDGGEPLLFADQVKRGESFLVLTSEPTDDLRLALDLDLPSGIERGGVHADEVRPLPGGPWLSLHELGSASSATANRVPGDPGTPGDSGSAGASSPERVRAAGQVRAVADAATWFAHDADVHFLVPRGLEQYTGGAWGTRDVCQGPVGRLLAAGDLASLRALLVQVFNGQQSDGTWPQWFDFQPAHLGPYAEDSHGDVVYWPLLALGEYLLAAGDPTILDEPADMVWPDRRRPGAPLFAHVARALDVVAAAVTAGDARLPAYGHGDWNDALQPAESSLAASMSSSWTAVLRIQALRTLAHGLGCAPAQAALATRARGLAEATAAAFEESFLIDGELAGYLVLGGSEGAGADDAADARADTTARRVLVHPRDTETGLRHGLLTPIHAIAADLLSPADARTHLDMIAAHLLGPDGARLFDRPSLYEGGVLRTFRRAEAASFFGREIGLMYTHAHLRYVEALCRFGEAEAAWEQLLRVVPFGLGERVPVAAPRQANCYASSSDGVFADRAQAAAGYSELMAGRVNCEAGWRVYSSGPGLFLRLLTESVAGLRRRAGGLEIDPCLPPALDGLMAWWPLGRRAGVRVRYVVRGRGVGVSAVFVVGEGNRTKVPMTPLRNPYRPAGVAVSWADVTAAVEPHAELVVTVGDLADL